MNAVIVVILKFNMLASSNHADEPHGKVLHSTRGHN